MKLFDRSRSPARSVVFALNDPGLAEQARRLADFAAEHAGVGHKLSTRRNWKRQQIVICSCGMSAPPDPRGALMEDELIDDG